VAALAGKGTALGEAAAGVLPLETAARCREAASPAIRRLGGASPTRGTAPANDADGHERRGTGAPPPSAAAQGGRS